MQRNSSLPTNSIQSSGEPYLYSLTNQSRRASLQEFARIGSTFRLLEVATWDVLSGRNRQPSTASQAEALSVGYLGFRAKISC